MTTTASNDIAQYTRAIEASYRPSTASVEAFTVEVTMSSETPYMRRDMNGVIFNEVLSHEPGHVRLDKMNNGAPLLDNHYRDGSVDDDVIGVVLSARIDATAREAIAVVRFDTSAKGRELFRKVLEGTLRKFSIGYTAFKYEEEVVDTGETITRRIIDWQPYEVSLVAVPADDNANSRNQESLNSPKDSIMKANIAADPGATPAAADDTRAAAPPIAPVVVATPAADSGAVASLVRQALEDDRTRAANIQGQVRAAGFDDGYAAELVLAGTSELDASRAITARWAAANPVSVNGSVTTDVLDGGDRAFAMMEGMASSLLRSANVPDSKEVSDAERPYSNMSVTDMCRAMLDFRGESTAGLTRLQIVKQAFTRSGFHSSTDFPILFGNVINRSLARAYAYQARTFLDWTSSTTHADFRMVKKARLSSLVGVLDLIPEGGEYKAGTFSESEEGYAVHKFGALLTYTYEMAVNDDLNFLTRVPAAFALAAAQRQSDVVYAILTGNPNMSDGNALFSTAHKNLGTGAALSNESLSAAELMFLTQTDSQGAFINTTPKYLIVGPTNKALANRLMTGIAATKVEDINIHANAYTVIVEPRLGNAWFLVADPNSIDTIEVATLAGHPELYTEAVENFNIDGTQLKVRMVFGAKALDWRGMFMNPGA